MNKVQAGLVFHYTHLPYKHFSEIDWQAGPITIFEEYGQITAIQQMGDEESKEAVRFQIPSMLSDAIKEYREGAISNLQTQMKELLGL